MILCELDYFYHDKGPGASGNDLLNQTLYISGMGGAVMDGYYSDGIFVYTVSGGLGVVTSVETASSLGCPGTTPDPSPSPIPQGTLYNFAYNSTSASTACLNAQP